MLQPLLLTLLGAAGTGLGGLLVVLQPCLSFKRLGALQGLAAGLMLSISLTDLLPEAAEEIGFLPAQLCFYAGVAFFAAIVTLIPEPGGTLAAAPPAAAAGHQQQDQSSPCTHLLAGSPHGGNAGSAAGGMWCDADHQQQQQEVLLPNADGLRRRASTTAGAAASAAAPAAPARLDNSAGGAPGQWADSCRDQQQQQQQQQQQLQSPLPPKAPPHHQQQQQQQQLLGPPSPAPSAASTSTSCGADLQVLLRDASELGCRSSGGGGISSPRAEQEHQAQRHRQQILMSGLITAVGIALHNFPEGVAVFLASHKSTAVGLSLACAIALHNIPEGVAVALPVYFATGSRWRGLQTAVLSGLAEPLAVLLLGVFFPFLQLNKHVVDGCLAGVGGIMAFLAFHELLPLSMQHAGKPMAVGCLFGGMCLMSVTLHVLNTHVLAGLH